jgi:hypothetical protein
MGRTFTLQAASIMILAVAPIDNASAGSFLEIDGLFHVPSASMEHARVTVQLGDVIMNVLTNDLRHINLRLDLQTTWTLSFEEDGCRSKELFFDTRMSAEQAANAPFLFRFEVTLEVEPSVSALAYAGPVGYIRFDSARGDFDYDLDYRLSHTAGGELLDKPVDPAASVISVSDKRGSRERHWGPAFIDPTREMERMAELLRTSAMNEGAVNASAPTVITNEEGVSSIAREIGIVPEGSTVERSVIVEQEREITIVRVRNKGVSTEYRRIAHSNGTVLHFKNASNCTYHEYVAAVGR